MALYFLRHGQSEANLAVVFSPADTVLTSLGSEQALVASKQLLEYDISRIVCSALERSWQTACIVAKTLGIHQDDIVRDARLNEYDAGTLTGVSSQNVGSSVLTSAAGAENPEAFQARVIEAITQYKKIEGNTLIVGHAGAGCVLETKRLGISPATFFDVPEYPNCHIIKLDIEWL